MNITKALAEEVATKMVLPITEKINTLTKERVSIADEVISKSIPKEIADCYCKYKKYFQISHCVTLYDGSHEVRIDDTSYFPAPSSWYPHISSDTSTIERIETLRMKIDKTKDEKSKMYNSIVSTLLSLRTFKRAKENFPDAYEFMAEYEEEGKTALALPIDDILSTIKKYK